MGVKKQDKVMVVKELVTNIKADDEYQVVEAKGDEKQQTLVVKKNKAEHGKVNDNLV